MGGLQFRHLQEAREDIASEDSQQWGRMRKRVTNRRLPLQLASLYFPRMQSHPRKWNFGGESNYGVGGDCEVRGGLDVEGSGYTARVSIIFMRRQSYVLPRTGSDLSPSLNEDRGTVMSNC